MKCVHSVYMDPDFGIVFQQKIKAITSVENFKKAKKTYLLKNI